MKFRSTETDFKQKAKGFDLFDKKKILIYSFHFLFKLSLF